MDANSAATAASATLALTMVASLDGDGDGAATAGAGAAVVSVTTVTLAVAESTVAVRPVPAEVSSWFSAVAKVEVNPGSEMAVLAVLAASAVVNVIAYA